MKAALITLAVLAFIVFVIPANGSWQWALVLIVGVLIVVSVVENHTRE